MASALITTPKPAQPPERSGDEDIVDNTLHNEDCQEQQALLAKYQRIRELEEKLRRLESRT